MTIASRFPEVLKIAERDGEGGLAAEPPAIIKGEAANFSGGLPAHPVYGDWTDGSFEAVLRSTPGGSPVASYNCAIGEPVGLLTPVLLSLAADAVDTVELPVTTQVAELFFSLIFTPDGGIPDTLITTRQLVRGG